MIFVMTTNRSNNKGVVW